MPDSNPSPANVKRDVAVREMPIELSQFLKFGGLAGSGGEAKQAVAEGRVRVNGVVESKKGRKLSLGDEVTLEGTTIVVRQG